VTSGSLSRRTRLLTLGALACAGMAQAAPPAGTPLFIPLRPEALAVAVGANGFVIGGTFYSGGGFHWMPTSGVTDIGGVSVAAVSRDGVTIVGNALDNGGRENAAVWAGGKQWRTLGSVRSARPCDLLLSSAYGTSADGRVVVGLAWDTCSYARAFRWEEGTGMVDLGSLAGGDRSTRANGVSADGRIVVGWEETREGYRQGAKWVDGREELVQGPNGIVGEAHAANRDGSLIVGGNCDFTRPLGRLTAWTWTPAAGVTCFPVVPPSWALNRPYNAVMFGTSDDGRVIGGALTFGLDAESVVWFDGEPFMLRDYLRSHGIPDAFEGWINTGFVTDVSVDGRTLVGYGAGPTAFQGFLVVLPEMGKK
jgi:probable HAF family extracellular repeat protein